MTIASHVFYFLDEGDFEKQKNLLCSIIVDKKNKMVACTEFESVDAALRGQCVEPLHQQARNNVFLKRQYYLIINSSFWQVFYEIFVDFYS